MHHPLKSDEKPLYNRLRPWSARASSNSFRRSVEAKGGKGCEGPLPQALTRSRLRIELCREVVVFVFISIEGQPIKNV